MDHQAQVLIHLGDIGETEVIDALAVAGPDGKQVPAHLVFGNTDWDTHDLQAYAERLGISVDHPAGRLEVTTDSGPGILAYTHGHDNRPMTRALKDNARYLCHGHTHLTTDHKQGQTRVINPGALCRAKEYTVALLDTETDDLTFIRIDKG